MEFPLVSLTLRLARPVLFCCLISALPLAVAAAEKEYPLRVQLVESNWNNNGFGNVQGYGRGNVIDAETTRGFDFTYTCSVSLGTTAGNYSYLGRWKKDEQRLVVQGTEIGGRGKYECEMKTMLRREVYLRRNGQVVVVPEEQFKAASASLHPADKDPAHYPVKLSILAANWQPGNFGSMGSGKGNLTDGETVEGFNFATNCVVTFEAGVGVYSAQWILAKSRLRLLTKAIGEDQFYNCELKVELVGGVYVKNNDSGVISRLTRDEFRTLVEKRRVPPPPVSGVSVMAKAKVSVVSVPDGADIELDGKYVGSTPSVLEWQVGDHAISLKKPGYRDWLRKMTLVAGEVKVSANLEKADGTN